MEIVKKVAPPQQTPQQTPTTTPAPAQEPTQVETLPKQLPTAVQRPVTVSHVGDEGQTPVFGGVPSNQQPMPTPSQVVRVAQPAVEPYDDGIVQRDPNTGQPLTQELDRPELDYLGNDPLRAIYQALVWAADSFKKLAQTTPAVAALSPQTESIIDQVATIGYQVTNTGAELTRGLWNWPFTRVILNQQLESVLHPEESSIFNRLYTEWYQQVITPVETGQAKYDPEIIKKWVQGHSDEIADPAGFVRLCSQRYTMEKIASKSAWTPTNVLDTYKPTGVRQKTTTGLENVFKKRPG